MESQTRKKLSLKIVFYCTCFACLLCLLIGGIGYVMFAQNIWESNYKYCDSVLASAKNMIDEDDWKQCIETKVQSENYQMVQQHFDGIKYDIGVEYIYMIDFADEQDYNSARYVFTAYDESELSDGSERMEIGTPCAGSEGAFDVEILKQFQQAYQVHTTEIQYIKNPVDEDGERKTMLTAYQMLWDSSGSPIGIFAVDMDMTKILHTLNQYLMVVIIGGAGVLCLFLLIFISVVNRGVVKPIKEISESARDFVIQTQKARHPSEIQFKEVFVNTNDEIEELAESLNYMTREMQDYMVNLKIVTEDKEMLTEQVDIAKEIQLDMLPNVFPAFPNRHDFEIYAGLQTGKEGGGSFYDYFLIDRTHLGIVMGEVQGYGISTMLTSVIASTHIRNYAQIGYHPARVLAETNNQLIGRNGEGRLGVHVFFAKIDLESGHMLYISAGKINPLFKHSFEDWQDCSERNSVGLGIMKNVPFAVQQQSLVQGDLLFLYSPSAAEIANKKGEIFDDIGMREEMEATIEKEFELSVIYQRMQEKLALFRAGAEQKPDSAMVFFRYFGANKV